MTDLVGRYITFVPAGPENNAVIHAAVPSDDIYWTLIAVGPDDLQNNLGRQLVETLNHGSWHARAIAEEIDEGSGFWRACSGCQESVDGYVSERDYPHNRVFRCQPGGGCSECAGLGVIWDDVDYEAMARATIADDRLLETAKSILPVNLDLGNANIGDDVMVPIDVTMGELRALKAAIRTSEGL